MALLGVLVTAGLLYASQGGGEAHGAAHGGVSSEKLWDLLFRTMNFAALVFILVYFLAKPIANALGSRRQAIKDNFEDLEARRAEAERFYKEHEGKLASLDQEVQQIIAAAVAQGELEKQRIIDEAQRAAEDIKRQAEMAVQQEFAEAKKKLREEVAEQAAAMAEEIIGKNLQESDQAKLIGDYLSKVGGLK